MKRRGGRSLAAKTRLGSVPQLRRLVPAWFLELFVVSQVVLAHLVLAAAGVALSPATIGFTLRSFGPAVLVTFLVAVAVRGIASLLFDRRRRYLRAIASWEWVVLSLRLVLLTIAMLHVYGWVKLTLPLTRPRWFDQELWNFDAALFGGHSPSVLFLELFSHPWLIRAIDWSYGTIFQAVSVLSLPFVLSLANNRIRIAYAAGAAGLWIAGGWLYFAVPSMGPAYAFGDIWDGVAHLLPMTRALQAVLFRNFLAVGGIAHGVYDPSISVALGIAAFPSLHVAFLAFVSLWLRMFHPRTALGGAFVTALMFVGSIITGWHYAVDSIAGLALGVAAWGLSIRLYRAHRLGRAR
jgi:hypothetical protein